MRFALLSTALALGLSGPALAEDPEPASPPPAQEATADENLTLGEVTASNVNVRAGNSMNHRIVCVASKGDQVLIAAKDQGRQTEPFEAPPEVVLPAGGEIA